MLNHHLERRLSESVMRGIMSNIAQRSSISGLHPILWLLFAMAIAGCGTSLPAQEPAALGPSPVPSVIQAEELRKLGPSLRRHLIQRGRQALEAPEPLDQQLRPITVVIQARRDITEELETEGVNVRSVTKDGIVVITADVPLEVIPDLLALSDLKIIELSQPVPPAEQERGTADDTGRMQNER